MNTSPPESPYARAVRELVALGYHAIPLLPANHPSAGRGKAPGEVVRGQWCGMSKWERFRDKAPSDFERGMWARNLPGANVGLVLGSPVGLERVIAVDLDVSDFDELDELIRALPASPMVKKGAKGQTNFYRGPPTIKSKPYSHAITKRRLVDLLTGNQTRQTVCPPSVHPDGPVYTWLAGPVAASDLPLFDDDALSRLEDTLRALGWDPDAARATPARPKPQTTILDEEDYWTEVKAAALANLDAWVPTLDLYGCRRARGGYEAVATWRDSSTGRPTEQRKRNLSIQPNGIKDFGTDLGYSAIDLVMAAKGVEQGEATSWLRDQLGLTIEPMVFQPSVIVMEGERINAETGEILEEPAPFTPPAGPDELPDELTRVPGLLGDLTDWICDTSRRPQRGLSLGAALCLIGTAAGRKYAGPTRTGTQLYALGLARTSAGKDHALQQIARVLASANMNQHLGPSQFMSLSAVVKRLMRQPLTLCAMDEFGAFMARINNRRSSTHERAITGVLRTAWGSSFQTMTPPEWSGQAGEPIHAPALSIYGVSTPEEFYASLEGGDVHNGFLNRFLLLSTRLRPREREPKADAHTVPDHIRNGMHRLYGSGSALMTATQHNGQADGPMITALWADDAAKKVYSDFGRYVENRERDIAFLARTVEMAQRLATIRAIGIRPDAPRVTVDDMEWGRDIALWSAERMMVETSDYLADTQNQADAQRVVRIIKERGRIKHGDLVKAMQHRVKARDLKELIAGLIDAGQVRAESERTAATGPEQRWYIPT